MRRDETKPPSVDKRKVARRATGSLDELLRPPVREGALRIKKLHACIKEEMSS